MRQADFFKYTLPCFVVFIIFFTAQSGKTIAHLIYSGGDSPPKGSLDKTISKVPPNQHSYDPLFSKNQTQEKQSGSEKTSVVEVQKPLQVYTLNLFGELVSYTQNMPQE